MKRFLLILSILTLIPFSFKFINANAQDSSEEINLESEIDDLIESLDLTELEEYLESLPKEIVGNDTLKDQLLKILLSHLLLVV